MPELNEKPNSFQAVYDSIRRLLTLQLDYARLTVAEKFTVLLSAIAFYSMAVALASLVLIFLSIGFGHLLVGTALGRFAYFIVAGMYIVLLVLLFIMRKQLIINPIARFMSRLFVEPPKNQQES